MKNKLISFIIPAYNASSTIKKTIDSILNQKETEIDFEILVIDDGSTDNLKSKVDEYSSIELKKIKYIKKQNGGLSDARNFGTKNANGDYIVFVDADDYINSNLSNDIKSYLDENVDLIKWNIVLVDEKNEMKNNVDISQVNEIISGQDGFNNLFGKDPYLAGAWNYCIKKELVPEFPIGMYHEDFAVIPLVILKANKMVIIDKYEYYYVQTENSIMRNQDKKKRRKRLEDTLIHFDNLIKSINEMKIDKITKENAEIFCTNSLLINMKELKEEDKKYFKKELAKRKIYQYIQPRNFKQKCKRLLLKILY